MNPRNIIDKLDELRTLILANTLMFHYWKPAEIKETEPESADEAEDRFYKDFIKPKDEHELIKKYDLPDWNEDFKIALQDAWPKWKEKEAKDNEILLEEHYIEPHDFLRRIHILVSNLILSFRRKVEDLKRQGEFKSDTGLTTLYDDAQAFISHFKIFQKYYKSITFTDEIPEITVNQYSAVKNKTFEIGDVILEELKSLNGLKNENMVDRDGFKRALIQLAQIKLPPTSGNQNNSPLQTKPTK